MSVALSAVRGFRICRVGNLLPTESRLIRVGKQVAHPTRLPKGLAVDEAILLGKETINQTEQVEVPVNDGVSDYERKET